MSEQSSSKTLLTTPAERASWKAWFAEACAKTSVAKVFSTHPRADDLSTGFAVGSYLANNADVAAAVSDTSEAVFHFLEFGMTDGPRGGTATDWNPRFVARHHGHTLHADLDAAAAARQLIALGVAPQDLILCERDLWLNLGLHGPLLQKIFHHECYYATANAPDLTPDRIACIRHFASHGLDAGLPAHPDHLFDPAFYRTSLEESGITPPPDADLPRHWARVGLRSGIHANASAAARALYGIRLPQAGITGLPIPSTGQLAHVTKTAMASIARLDASDPALRTFLVDLARHKRSIGAMAGSEALLTRALDANSDDARVAIDLANTIAPQKDHPREFALRSIAPIDFDAGTNRIIMAELALTMDDLDKALSLAASVPETAQAHIHLRRRVRGLGRSVFERIWADLPAHLARHTVTHLQSLLTRAINIYAPRPDVLRRAGSITRVAILANDDIYQCKLYRADQKADQLRTQGIQVRVYLQSRDVTRLAADLDRFDAVIFQRTPAFPATADLMMAANKAGLATFFDIDDQVFDAAVFPPPLDAYAGQIDADQHARVACGVPLFAAAARLCDTGIASTDPLRDTLADLTLSGQAFTHANALGQAHVDAIAQEAPARSDKVVVFYGSGTKAHKAEFRDILEPALAQVLAARPGQVEVRLMGDFPSLSHLDLAHPDVTLLPPIWDFEEYMRELSKADIALSVLALSPVTDAKSELKWTEPAMFGIPAVVSLTPVMRQAIEDGVTGLLAADTKAFVDHILSLVDDVDLRAAIGTAAQTRVLEAYALPKMGNALLRQMGATLAPQKTRVLIANVFYPPQAIGGATRVVADNVQHLSDHYGDDFDIDILTTLDGGTTPHKLHPTSHSGTRIWSIVADRTLTDVTIADARMTARMEEVLDRADQHIVHIHCIQRLGTGLVELCRRRGIPYVITLHDGWWTSPNQFILGADGTPNLYDFTRPETLPNRARISKRCLDDATAVLAVSEPFAQLHRDIGLPYVTALPNGVSNLPKRQRTPPPEGRVRLALIGGASRHKGYELLRAAVMAGNFQNLDLLIVDHALLPGMQSTDVWNTTPVQRIPRQPQGSVGALYGSFDVLLAPSIWPESYGLVAREALALGLWVVASDQGAVGADVTEGVNGHIVSVNDHTELMATLARIDADPERYTQSPTQTPSLPSAAAQGDALAALYAQILQDAP